MQAKRIGFCGLGQVATWILHDTVKAGHDVSFFDPNPTAGQGLSDAKRCADLPALLEACDILIESVPEDPSVKRALYSELDKNLTQTHIVTSNTSFLLPSDFLPADFRYRHRFSCFHFYRPQTAVDLMPLPETQTDVLDILKDLAKSMGQEPILISKPTRGYLVGTMASAAADAALELLVSSAASPEAIDQSWKKITGMPQGPLEILDEVGLETALKIRLVKRAARPQDTHLDAVISLLKQYVEKGYLGKKSGRGIFSYPK